MPPHPAPVVHRIAIGHRLATVLFGALHKAVPERMPAAYYAVSYVVTFQTIDPKQGRKVLVEIEIGGCGALPYRDGASAHSIRHAQQFQHPDGDDRERHAADLPRLRPAARLRAAPAGSAAGSACGANGGSIVPSAQLSTNLDRFKFRPFGLAGRRAGGAERALSDRDGRTPGAALQGHEPHAEEGRHHPPGNLRRRRLRRADERIGERVERDVRLGYVSPDGAASSYGRRHAGTV